MELCDHSTVIQVNDNHKVYILFVCLYASLSSLSDVLGALAGKRSHIPYRNSILTYLLQDFIGTSINIVAVYVSTKGNINSMVATSQNGVLLDMFSCSAVETVKH